jgi:hypothetical protein
MKRKTNSRAILIFLIAGVLWPGLTLRLTCAKHRMAQSGVLGLQATTTNQSHYLGILCDITIFRKAS